VCTAALLGLASVIWYRVVVSEAADSENAEGHRQEIADGIRSETSGS
jgi:hypothetical protein